MDFSEKWGTDVDEAVRLALIDLKLTIDDVEVTVLEEPSKGFFGIGSKLAKVRVEKKKPAVSETIIKDAKQEKVYGDEPRTNKITDRKFEDRVAKSEKTEKRPEKKNSDRPAKSEKKEKKSEKVTRERPADLVAVTEHEGIDFLKEVIEKMDLSLEVTASKNDETMYFDIEGRDSGTLIGKRGQTLDAIQYLVSLVVNKGQEKYIRVIVDAENYRAKRERTLENLANRLADRVVKTRRSVKLEPMNPYERKVIHATLQNNSQVITRSEGEEPYRKVIIELAR